MKPVQHSLYSAAFCIAAFAPFAMFLEPRKAELLVGLQAAWAVSTCVAAFVLGRLAPPKARVLAIAIAVSFPIFYAPVIAIAGGGASPPFAWLVAMPLGLVVIYRGQLTPVVAGAIAATAVAAVLMVGGNQPAGLTILRLMQVVVAGALAVTGAVAFAKSHAREQAATAELSRLDKMRDLAHVAASVAHEVNNPLAYAKANIELLARDLDDVDGLPGHERRQMLDEVLSGLDRIRTTVAGLQRLVGDTATESNATVIDNGAARRMQLGLPSLGPTP